MNMTWVLWLERGQLPSSPCSDTPRTLQILQQGPDPWADSQDLPPPAPNSAGPPKSPPHPWAYPSASHPCSRLAKVTGALIHQVDNLTPPHPIPSQSHKAGTHCQHRAQQTVQNP